MTNLIVGDTQNAGTMTSLQIAEVTGKSHAHVMRDIRQLIEQGLNESNFGLVDYTDAKGEKRPMFQLTKKGSLILASGYNALLREKIIDRWEELELQTQPQIPQTFAEALMLAAQQAQQIEEQQKQLVEQAPKVAFTDAVVSSQSSCLIGELAKLITQNGVEIGEKRLFEWLRKNKYLGSSGERYNIPMQHYVEQGLFELKKGVRSGHNGVMHTTITTKVTGKGQVYFVNKFLAKQRENKLF